MDPIFQATRTPNLNALMYMAPASQRYKTQLYLQACCTLNLCMCAAVDDLLRRTYVAVYENKIEYNYPWCNCWCLCDQVGVVYFDRTLTAAVTPAGCCTPAFTHCSCCPTCFDICGEAIVLHGATCCDKNQTIIGGICCCRAWTLLPGLDNAGNLAAAILSNRAIALAKLQAGGQVVMA
ncbi:hypothetical protein CAOG_00580 [Capsaspora owczarzaki ATCC 30864]|uniref:Uncharacterized protein n=1 Tax=Capsaspora owczarzaki (strain ATCC 30864) TaxID=595528 RepID=A0A0D2U1D9_CAPO3|nr:hypothetical protein CAOG_00580 [Capsaspora owczarzaki ATCC 30864]KJE89021.1 hypothetical protein CAOG_000580 [Capsaspora owczarzaki ATCC 30864]|eukprot:XP_004365451.1 hypothetical protein CAOG_00580 [Capsaspora owczarzaki ATCC 30864]